VWPCRVVGANLCVQSALEVKGKVVRVEGVVAGKEAHTVNCVSTLFQRQHFVAGCLSSCVCEVFGLHNLCDCFPSFFSHKLVPQAKRAVWPHLL
jgi:hypothetical protein